MPGTVPQPNETTPPVPDATGIELRSSAYDRASSFLATMLIVVGSATLLLLLVWLTGRMLDLNIAVPVEFEEIGDGGGLGENEQLDPNVEIPGVETEFEEPELNEALTTITDALAANPAMLEDPTLWDANNRGSGGPAGDGRAPGDGTGRPGKPRNWQVRFPEGNTINSYAQQLDSFGIELGVLESGNKVTYVFNLSKETPDHRTGQADAEERYYLTWRNGTLQQTDRELIKRAGVSANRGLIMKFIPRDLEVKLFEMEQEAARDISGTLMGTHFEVYSSNGNYAFRVFDQSFGL